MDRLHSLGRGRRLVVALVAGAAVFGIASVVQADIPDNGIIHGCYGKEGTAFKGQLRVRDSSRQEQCRAYENPLDWNASGPTGPTGATGPTGPAGISLFAVVNADGTLVHGTATGAVKNGSGDYTVTFGRDVSSCAATAQPGAFAGSSIPAGDVSVLVFTGGSPDEVFVQFTNSIIGPVDDPFFLIVAC
jgi:hypothetical protein